MAGVQCEEGRGPLLISIILEEGEHIAMKELTGALLKVYTADCHHFKNVTQIKASLSKVKYGKT